MGSGNLVSGTGIPHSSIVRRTRGGEGVERGGGVGCHPTSEVFLSFYLDD